MGVLGFAPAIFLTVDWLLELAAGEGGKSLFHRLPEPIHPYRQSMWIASAVLALAGPLVGRWLVGVGRHQVLLLRRFRDAATEAAVTRAVSIIGSSWRLVTLDDHVLRPIGADPRATEPISRADRVATTAMRPLRAFVRSVPRIVKVVALAALVAVVLSLTVGLVGGRGRLTAAVFYYSLIAVLFCLAGLALIPLLRLVWSLFVRPAIAPVRHGFRLVVEAARRGSTATPIHIRSGTDIVPTLRRIGKSTRSLFGARLTVVTVSGIVWQRTVVTFAERADVVLVDVSDPSESVVWEVEQLTAMVRPCVFMGEQDRVARIVDGHLSDPYADRLRGLLDGRDVLTYSPDTDFDTPRPFARVLEDRLERPVVIRRSSATRELTR